LRVIVNNFTTQLYNVDLADYHIWQSKTLLKFIVIYVLRIKSKNSQEWRYRRVVFCWEYGVSVQVNLDLSSVVVRERDEFILGNDTGIKPSPVAVTCCLLLFDRSFAEGVNPFPCPSASVRVCWHVPG